MDQPPIKENLIKNLHELYDKDGFINKYGGSLLLAIVIIIVFLLFIVKHSFAGYKKSLKKNWNNIKCNPLYMPFAGQINAPEETSKIEYTIDNFNGCLNKVLEKVVKVETAPINKVNELLNEKASIMQDGIQNTRKLFSKVRESAGGLFKTSQSKLFNITVPLKQTMALTKNMLSRIQGIMTTGLYSTIGINTTGRSFAFAFKIALIIFFIAMIFLITIGIIVAITVMFSFFPFTLIAGFVLLSPVIKFLIFIIFEGLTAMTKAIGVAGDIVYLTSNDSLCFDENTLVKLKNNENVKIKDIKLDDELIDGGIVTAKFKVTSENQPMYKINDIIVSGKHMVKNRNERFIEVEKDKDSRKIFDYKKPYLYCLNTTTKRLIINNTTFLDWDEIDEQDLNYLNERVSNVEYDNIHRYLECGIDGETEIELLGGEKVKLKNIKVGDILKNKEKVLGVVEINEKNVSCLKKYKIDECIIKSTPNNRIIIKDLGTISLTTAKGESVYENIKLHHIITNTKSFMINDVKILDYNGGLEQLIWPEEYPL